MTQQIDLFGSKQERHEPKSPGRLEERRPSSIHVTKIHSDNLKWRECKIIGKNISIRSYSAACAFNNKLYVYGGYQMLNGSLDDFYCISLDESLEQFHWYSIMARSETTPGCRSKHALLAGKSKIYLVGGLQANSTASHDIFEFDTLKEEWKLLVPNGIVLPGLESFGAVRMQIANEEKIFIACGFSEDKALLSNAVYEYNINRNTMSLLFPGTEFGPANVPSPRIGCALASDKENLYLFGGKGAEDRLNDIWSFGLSDCKYKRLPENGVLPAVRNGHTMNYVNGRLLVFGGIHDITWELDDLHIYDIKTGHWTTLEQDSPRKLDRKMGHGQLQGDKSLQKRSSKKKSWYDGSTLNKNSPIGPSPTKKNFSNTNNQELVRTDSPGKMLDEQKKKVFYQKKAEMLKNFEVASKEKTKLLSLETSSQAMKNSLDVIGNPDPKVKIPEDRLTDFGKESASKFLAPLLNNSNIVIGKKPCARDGHCAVIIADELIIFGGDRHQMSFNDVYKLSLSLANKELH